MIPNWEDIEEALVESTGDRPRTKGDEHIHTCPFCGKPGHFYVNYRKGVYNCYHCGDENEEARGPVEKLAASLGVELEDEDSALPASLEELDSGMADLNLLRSAALDVGVEDEPADDPNESTVVPPPSFEFLTTMNSGRYFGALSYLIGRGIPWQTAQWYGIGVSHGGSRVVFPDYNHRGQLRWWQCRVIGEYQPGPRYEGPPGDRAGKVGHWHRALTLPVAFLGVCEGPISAIVAGPEFTWLWGKQYSHEQVDVLSRADRPVVIALDGEARAYKSALGLANRLREAAVQALIVPMPGGHDPASMGRQAFRTLLASVLARKDTTDLDFLSMVVEEYV